MPPALSHAAVRQFDPVLMVIYVGYIIIIWVVDVAFFSLPQSLFVACQCIGTVPSIATLVALLGLTGFERWRYARRMPTSSTMIAFFAARMVLIEAFAWLWGDVMMTTFLYLTLALVAYGYWGKRASRWVLIVAIGQMLVRQTVVLLSMPAFERDTDHLLVIIICIVVGGLIALPIEIIDRERTYRAHAESLLDQLEQMHRRLLEVATVEERNRLARDIHDSLGHRLTVIHIQLEKALAYQFEDPTTTTQSIHDAKRMARAALDDVRQSVGALRQQEAFRLTTALEALVADFRTIDLDVTLMIQGDETTYSQQVLMTLFRVAQEGITNSRKHGHPLHVKLSANFGATEAVLTVYDDGVGFDGHDAPHSGHGLLGLRERLELMSGTLHIESSRATGTILRAVMPRNPITLSRQLAAAEVFS